MRLILRAALWPLSIGMLACGNDATSPAPKPTPSAAPAVLEHHAGPRRNGRYVQPTLTRAAAATMQLDPSFGGIVKGNVYAQPLYVADGPGGRGTFFVATEDNELDAIDEATGARVWTRTLGPATPRTGAGCGNVSPLGVTGTPDRRRGEQPAARMERRDRGARLRRWQLG
jgi:hypothetical protein